MKIRRAEEKDIERIIELLHEVLEVHAKLRPDIFVSGTTKYSKDEISAMLSDDDTPIFVAADESDTVMGYVFCQRMEQPHADTMVPFSSIYIDDLCVDPKCRGQHVAEELFTYVKEEAGRLGCYEITLNVWNGNAPAERFYEKMGMKPQEKYMELVLVDCRKA